MNEHPELDPQPGIPRKGLFDDNPNYVYDPMKSNYDNMRAGYDGNPPLEAVEFALYLDASDDLLNQFRAGEITAEEFSELHDRMTEAAMRGPEQPPSS